MEVDIRPGTEEIHLNFKGAGGQAAGIGFMQIPLRQWLMILQGAYRVAEWPQSCWPVWMKEGRGTMVERETVVWH